MSVQMEEFVWNGQLNISELYNCPHVVDNLLVCHFLRREKERCTYARRVPGQSSLSLIIYIICLSNDNIYIYIYIYIYIKLV